MPEQQQEKEEKVDNVQEIEWTKHLEESKNEPINEEIATVKVEKDLGSNSDDPKSQMKLALSLGYPMNWHVIRVYPHPASPDAPDSFMDRIYAGDPSKNVDAYFNHHAAMTAALKFVEGESTGYENKGGQMLPRKPNFKANDEVEVLYEEDGQWYDAQVVKVKTFVDDIRYTIYYEDEDATQTNVSEDLLRKRTAKSVKKKEPKKPKKKAASSAPSTPAKKSKTKKLDKSQQKITAFVTSSAKKNTNTKKRILDPDHEEALEQANSLGFPDGWTVRVKGKGHYDIRSPDETHKFKTKRAALEFLEKNPSEKESSANETRKKKISSSEDKEEAGDPPWRRVGHEYLGRSVRYPIDESESKYQKGKVAGWLSEKDQDSDGNPAFLSEKTGKPGKLFHIIFEDSDLLFVDLEGFEVEEILMEENEEGESMDEDVDEDELPVSKMVKRRKS